MKTQTKYWTALAKTIQGQFTVIKLMNPCFTRREANEDANRLNERDGHDGSEEKCFCVLKADGKTLA